MTTYGAVLARGRARLAEAGVESAEIDARVLLAAVADLDGAALIGRSGEPVTPSCESIFDDHVMRRLAGEPVARILRYKEFWGLRIGIGPGVFVPRPETETLVDAVLRDVIRRGLSTLSICDLGTGSGAIVIALLRELPKARGLAVDICDDALAVADSNADMQGVGDRVTFVAGDFAQLPDEPFDVVVSNPPYVRSDVLAKLPTEVRDFDPALALDGGRDGLAAYRVILGRAASLVATGGVLAMEVGFDQGDSVAAMCHEAGLKDVQTHPDLAGVPCVVMARR